MTVRKLIALLVVLASAAVPAVAFADDGGPGPMPTPGLAGPGGISTGGTIELRGILTHYVAPRIAPIAGNGSVFNNTRNPLGIDGSVTISVLRSSNGQFVNTIKTIRLSPMTKIVLGSHSTIRDGDLGAIKITLGDIPPLG